MDLPLDVKYCIEALEGASFATYAVGGCVRDHLLGLIPQDFDLCTAALPHEIQAVFHDRTLVLAGVKHGTVGVVGPDGVVEITTFRTEGDYSDHRHPGWIRFVDAIEEDLARRDLTINAMAWSPSRGFCDPFGGQEDLRRGILRAVGDPTERFREDPLRILRAMRFAVRYHLTPDPETEKAMHAQAPLMDSLARERVFDELCKLLPLVTVEELIRYAPIIAQAIPELAPALGFDQRSPHHAYDLFTHIAHVTAAMPRNPVLRWAGLLHDVGKPATFTLDQNGRGHFYGHAKESARIADQILLRLKAPTALRQQVVHLIDLHMTRLEPDRKILRRRLSQLGQQTVGDLLLLQEADMAGKGTGPAWEVEQFVTIRQILEQIQAEDACLSIRDLAVDGLDLMAIGFQPGKELGICLQRLLDQVVDEQIPNRREDLLAAARQHLSQLNITED